MELYGTVLLAAFAGGAMRGVVGFLKYQFQYKDVKFRPYYFAGMVALSGAVGVATAYAVSGAGIPVFGGAFTAPIAFIVGYAGGDFIENLYKIIAGKTSMY